MVWKVARGDEGEG